MEGIYHPQTVCFGVCLCVHSGAHKTLRALYACACRPFGLLIRPQIRALLNPQRDCITHAQHSVRVQLHAFTTTTTSKYDDVYST